MISIRLVQKLQCYMAVNFIPADFLKKIYGWNTRPYPEVIQIKGKDYYLKDENTRNEHYER